ncbi:MAG: hypothetical protein GAK29_02447 [Acinetobacter bereziniae]|uniref:Uncharacterized protein n=1 Tax=Acinetobacter bereziniae TaxID=106648 RepID=A0A833PF12_ACIBZ|nr:MAG: hypothetical protein GAK29_02447 [Acinetobacter bereziniae]
MRKFILNIMFKYKWYTTIFCILVYLFLAFVFLDPLTISNILGSLLFLLLLLSSIWNVSFLLLDSVDENSSSNEIAGRAIIIFTYFLSLIYLMVS